MPYTHFRYIAWEVPTATSTPGGPVVCDYPAGDLYQAIGRLPVPVDTPDDARRRLQRLAGVVNLAANRLSNHLADNATTLKVFVVPEFYFRPPAATGQTYYSGTYPVSDMNAILNALNQMFVHADFQHWHFVPGTLLWNTLVDRTRDPLFFNTLIHVQGGQQDSLNVIEKQQPSSIDGMPAVGVPARDTHYRLVHQRWSTRKKRVDVVDGVRFGYDVCLDHLNSPNCRVLKHVLDDWHRNEGAVAPDVSLHVLSAAGMSIQPPSVCARTTGYILRNDGIANPGARSEMRQVQAYTAPDPLGVAQLATTASDLRGTATLAAAVAAEDIFAVPAGALQVPSKGGTYATFPQQVVFYPVTALP